jgi:hypothetical protein
MRQPLWLVLATTSLSPSLLLIPYCLTSKYMDVPPNVVTIRFVHPLHKCFLYS